MVFRNGRITSPFITLETVKNRANSHSALMQERRISWKSLYFPHCHYADESSLHTFPVKSWVKYRPIHIFTSLCKTTLWHFEDSFKVHFALIQSPNIVPFWVDCLALSLFHFAQLYKKSRQWYLTICTLIGQHKDVTWSYFSIINLITVIT